MKYKIAISGKANSGKDTLSQLIISSIKSKYNFNIKSKKLAFADPIKDMAQIMFPQIPKEWLFGSSNYRNNIIPGTKKTVRELLIDIGHNLGRKYNENVWINNLEYRLVNSTEEILLISDVRFLNEWEMIKNHNFTKIRILRKNNSTLNIGTEIEQDLIKNDDFDHIIYNNGSLIDLQNATNKIVFNYV